MTTIHHVPIGGKQAFVWKPQALAVKDQHPPVQNTWYTILDTTTGGVSIGALIVRQINDETDNKDIEVRVTLDGRVITSGRGNAVDDTDYYVAESNDVELELGYSGNLGVTNAKTMEGDSIKIEMRITAVVGTNQKLEGRCRYYKKEKVLP